ncbi:MAG: hypothetical protein ACXAE3_05035, partial [Candidatus Kariarchaeaceae archaeon]
MSGTQPGTSTPPDIAILLSYMKSPQGVTWICTNRVRAVTLVLQRYWSSTWAVHLLHTSPNSVSMSVSMGSSMSPSMSPSLSTLD